MFSFLRFSTRIPRISLIRAARRMRNPMTTYPTTLTNLDSRLELPLLYSEILVPANRHSHCICSSVSSKSIRTTHSFIDMETQIPDFSPTTADRLGITLPSPQHLPKPFFPHSLLIIVLDRFGPSSTVTQSFLLALKKYIRSLSFRPDLNRMPRSRVYEEFRVPSSSSILLGHFLTSKWSASMHSIQS